jgi:hypothetical protein
MMTLSICILAATSVVSLIGWRVERRHRRQAERDAGRYVAELSQVQQERELARSHAQRDEGILDMLYRGGARAYRTFCYEYRQQRMGRTA